MELTEKTVETKEIFNGAIVRLLVDRAELPNGRITRREVVEHPGGVAILPLDGDDCVTLVRQYRYPFHRVITELPAGKLDPGEDHRVCALRELKEEVGMTPDELIYLGCLYASPGFCTEVLHMYLAKGLHEGACCPDEDEFLERVRMPFDALVEEIMKNEISDAKTVAAVLKAKAYLGR
ncbi:MAG: NUDIX hydrolase [Pseudoflavonifractor sp.]